MTANPAAMPAICIAEGGRAEAEVTPILKRLTQDPDEIAQAPILSSVILIRSDSPLSTTGRQLELVAKSIATMWSPPRSGQYASTFESFPRHLDAMREREQRILGLAVGTIGVPKVTGAFARLLDWLMPWRVTKDQAQACVTELA